MNSATITFSNYFITVLDGCKITIHKQSSKKKSVKIESQCDDLRKSRYLLKICIFIHSLLEKFLEPGEIVRGVEYEWADMDNDYACFGSDEEEFSVYAPGFNYEDSREMNSIFNQIKEFFDAQELWRT